MDAHLHFGLGPSDVSGYFRDKVILGFERDEDLAIVGFERQNPPRNPRPAKTALEPQRRSAA